ncbi:MAG: hypothetical protein HKN18_04220 [Silicimonas sp.]|nr:hypothetical protein [Silicimonas sp.]
MQLISLFSLAPEYLLEKFQMIRHVVNLAAESTYEGTGERHRLAPRRVLTGLWARILKGRPRWIAPTLSMTLF